MAIVTIDSIKSAIPGEHLFWLQEMVAPLPLEACVINCDMPSQYEQDDISDNKQFSYVQQLFDIDKNVLDWGSIIETTHSHDMDIVGTHITIIRNVTTGIIHTAVITDRLLTAIVTIFRSMQATTIIDTAVELHVDFLETLSSVIMVLDNDDVWEDLMHTVWGGVWKIIPEKQAKRLSEASKETDIDHVVITIPAIGEYVSVEGSWYMGNIIGIIDKLGRKSGH